MSKETELTKHSEQIVRTLGCCVLTVSDTRTHATDKSGALIRSRLVSAGHHIIDHKIVHDDVASIQNVLLTWCELQNCHLVLITGGTGVSQRDCTPEAVIDLLEKRLDGFGELFRMLSLQDIGPAAMLSRAVAGIRGSILVFAMPGSMAAVTLAMDRLILPAVQHMAWLTSH